MTKRKTAGRADKADAAATDPVDDDRTAPVDPELQALQSKAEDEPRQYDGEGLSPQNEAPSADDLNEALGDPEDQGDQADTAAPVKYSATGLHLLGMAQVPHLLLVLDGSDKDAIDAARAYCKAIRQDQPAKAAAIATHVGVNFGRS